MKVTFVYPRFEKFLESVPSVNLSLLDHFIGNFTTPPSLGISILAGLTPGRWQVELVDDNNGDPVDFSAQTDLVAINCFTPQATRAFELADGYRAKGQRVIMGGFFPSTMPEESLLHADAVNLGDGEPTWPEILKDAEIGALKPVYRGGSTFDLADMPVLRRDLFYEKSGYDWNADLVQTSRGCSMDCGMCAIPAHQGHRIRLRPVADIVNEVSSLKYDNVYLAEDILFFPNHRIAAWSRELMSALIPLEKKLFVSSTLSLNTSEDMLDISAKAGVKSFYCTLNVDARSIRALSGDKAALAESVELIKKIEDHGMQFFASFGIGREWDSERTADSILELCARAQIRTSEFFLFTPYPGSPQWEKLLRQDRILSTDWRQYNGAHVVWRPLGLEPEKLYDVFVSLWRDFYTGQNWRDTVKALKPDASSNHMAHRRHQAENR